MSSNQCRVMIGGESAAAGCCYCWLAGCWGFTTVPVTKAIRLSEWVTPGDTAILGMTSFKDGGLQHSSALAQSPKGHIEPNHLSEINPNSDSRSRCDCRTRRFVQYRVDQDQSQGQRPKSLAYLFSRAIKAMAIRCSGN